MDSRPDNASSKSFDGLIDRPTTLRQVLADLESAIQGPIARLRDGLEEAVRAGGESESETETEARGRALRAWIDRCDGLSRMTSRAFEFAELSRGDRPPRLVPFSIATFASEIDREFGPEAKRRGLAWSCAWRGEAPEVTADPELCRSAAARLVENALTYTKPGGRVDVRVDDDGPTWSLEVEDDGPGVPADALEKVFDPYVRRERLNENGAGLGLTLCREIASRLGGLIRLDSGEGRGVQVRLELPKAPRLPLT